MPRHRQFYLTGEHAEGALFCLQQLELKPPRATHDEVIELLHTAAEIEHSLLVQYLYAAYSLETDPEKLAQPSAPKDAVNLVRMWRDSLVTIAVQEMAHLLTIQNLLLFIGGPLNFEREDFPFKAELYPFHFALRPLTAASLASYIVAEMPRKPSRKIFPSEVEQSVRDRSFKKSVNRVGALYERLFVRFKQLDPRVFRAKSIEFQARPEEWGADSELLVHRVGSLEDALRALESVGRQGEGWEDHPDLESHFHRFLEIYLHPEFKNADKGLWTPFRPLRTNPVTKQDPSLTTIERDLDECQTLITDGEAQWWAHLFNLRYRMLLYQIDHSLRVGKASVSTSDGPMLLRQVLISWSRRQMTSGLREIAMMLVQLPADNEGKVPAPPFELTDSLAVPDHNADRWLRHRDMIQTSRLLMDTPPEGKSLSAGSEPILNRLRKLDEEMENFIGTHDLDHSREAADTLGGGGA